MQMDQLSIRTQGAGLRMWLCKAMVALHGGTVGCFSPGLGRGSTFFIEVPVDEQSPYSTPSHGDHRTVFAETFNGFADFGDLEQL